MSICKPNERMPSCAFHCSFGDMEGRWLAGMLEIRGDTLQKKHAIHKVAHMRCIVYMIELSMSYAFVTIL